MVNIEINGKKLQAQEGSMIIEAADEASIQIPRFCYHKKLSIAANCRMCLVHVDNAPKPLPACATPITEGMKVNTKTAIARDAQKAVMEFLLINHPLDCPICDQGGECELQDVAMGYGKSVSQYTEAKRSVKDKDLGSLISTDMTRCIHCTRCVRFGQEVAGLRELGATGRGEHTEIGTFIEQSVNSEVSGNVIDLCPVGALTSKPYRFSARAWEVRQYPSIAAHDCLGSNIFIHTQNAKVKRVVPRENEAVNEVWLSDRDRFSYLAIDHDDRVLNPSIKKTGESKTATWEDAFHEAANRLHEVIEQHGPEQVGFLISPNATTEEAYLLQKLARALGCQNIDHRLRAGDFSDQTTDPAYPHFATELGDIENAQCIMLIGSNVRKQQPLLALRLRKAALHEAKILCVNPADFDFNFDVHAKHIAAGGDILGALCKIVRQLAKRKSEILSAEDQALLKAYGDELENDELQDMVDALLANDAPQLILGEFVEMHPQAAAIRYLAQLISRLTAGNLNVLSLGCNQAGASIAGALPHRLPGAAVNKDSGLNVVQMATTPLKAYVLFGFEADLDCLYAKDLLQQLDQAQFVLSLSTYHSDTVKRVSDVILPISAHAETSGTFVNVNGRWQSFVGAVKALGESRPAWKVLRVLANVCKLQGFEYTSSEEVLNELQSVIPKQMELAYHWACPIPSERNQAAITHIAPLPIYACDPQVRRAAALQQTVDAAKACVQLNSALAAKLQFNKDDLVEVSVSENQSIVLPCEINDRVASDSVLIAGAMTETLSLGSGYSALSLRPKEGDHA